jgi:hypothetical protein
MLERFERGAEANSDEVGQTGGFQILFGARCAFAI